MRGLFGFMAVIMLSVMFVSQSWAWEREMSCYVGEDCPEGQEPLPTYWDEPCISFHLNEVGTTLMDFGVVREVVKASIAAWDLGERTSLKAFYAGETNEDRIGYNPYIKENTNIITFRDTDWEGSRAVMAYTSVTSRISTGEIFDADLELNSQYYKFGVVTENNKGVVDLQNTVTHELGHVFGLDHSDDETATMYWVADAGDTFMRDLAPDDIEGIMTVYPPGEKVASCEFKASYFEKPPYAMDEGYSSDGNCSIFGVRDGKEKNDILWLAFLMTVFILVARRRESDVVSCR